MPLRVAGGRRALNALLSNSYVSLHTGDPVAANEVTGANGYSRMSCAFSEVAGTDPVAFSNINILEFPIATALWGNITHYAIQTAATGGVILYADALTTAKNITKDDVLRFLARALEVKAT